MSTLTKLGLVAPPQDGPAQLVYDIETAPALVYTWGAFDQNIIATVQDWYALEFSYKWLNRGKVKSVAIWDSPTYTAGSPDDRYVAERLAALFDVADVIIAHNGDKFDRRKANARFLYHGIDPPSPYQSVDTLKVARREFQNYKNSLDDLGRLYLEERKKSHDGFALWEGAMNGDPKRQKEMVRYANQDVLVLEKLYVKLLPWMGMPGKPAAPNMGFWAKGELVCPKCGNKTVNINRWDKLHRTSVSEFPTIKCLAKDATVPLPCGGYSRLRNRVTQTRGKGVQAV